MFHLLFFLFIFICCFMCNTVVVIRIDPSNLIFFLDDSDCYDFEVCGGSGECVAAPGYCGDSDDCTGSQVCPHYTWLFHLK